MSERNTVIRSIHDLGLAAWFGGSLMGAVGLNGAAASQGSSETDTARIASAGWAKWTPANAVAIGLHLMGGTGLLSANAARVQTQQGVAASTLAKTVLTGAALAAERGPELVIFDGSGAAIPPHWRLPLTAGSWVRRWSWQAPTPRKISRRPLIIPWTCTRPGNT